MQQSIDNDYILRVRHRDELWVHREVMEANQRLQQKNKGSRLLLKIGDCWDSDLLYGPKQKNILLSEHLYLRPEQINQALIKLPFSLYGAHYLPKVDWDVSIVRDFNWFIHRNDPNRQFYFYDLYRRAWLDAGFVSFVGYNIITDKDACLDLFDQIHKNYYAPFYDEIYHAVRPLMPYRNFQDCSNLCDIIMQSKFSIVTETYIERTDVVCFSEKTFRVLQMPRPWLLLGATHSIRTLRDLGFYVFDDFVDHQYDSIDTQHSVEKKWQAIMTQVEMLRQMSVTNSMIDHWKIHTRKNRDLMRDWNVRLREEVKAVLDHAEDIAD